MRDVVTLDAAPVETGGLSEVGTFSMLANGKAFKILIDGIYANKPLAITRELWTNAFDSHAQAGIADRPFKAQLPTKWDDTFSVRDYGVSLTHEKVMGLYTTVFASSKEDTNSQVGKFGLGSKTPFAYTDSFAVTAILAGEKRLYNCYMDTDGIPKIALLITEPTDEEQGLEVSFSVRETDIDAFHRAARQVALGFDVIPVNNIELTKVETETLFEGAGWKVMKRGAYGNGVQGAVVRQGCVLYPIDANALNAVRQCEALSVLGREAIVIDMPIGSVDITPSRESLSYDPTTCKNLLDRLDGILTEVVEKMTAKIKDAPTMFAAIKARREILASINEHGLKNYIERTTLWRGRLVHGSISLTSEAIESLRRRGLDLHDLNHYRTRRGRTGQRRIAERLRRGVSIDPSNMPTFVYYNGETPKYLSYRLAAADRATIGPVYILPDFTPGGTVDKFLHVALGRPDEDLKFANLLDFQFDKPTSIRSGSLPSVTELVNGTFESCSTPAEGAENVFFVHTYKGDPKKGEHIASLSNLTTLWTSLKKLGVLTADATLIGIPASRKDIAKSIPEEWQHFYDVVGDLVTGGFDPVAASKGLAATQVKNRGTTEFLTVLELTRQHGPKPADADSLFLTAGADFTECVEELGAHTALHVALAELIRYALTPEAAQVQLAGVDPAPYVEQLDAMVERVRVSYPLIDFLARESRWLSSRNTDDYATVIDYVNLVDARENARRAENALCDAFPVD
jgi:hypothetical protein